MMTTILFGVIWFTGTIVALAMLILACRALLIPSGSVAVTLSNGKERTVYAERGTTVLSALNQAGVLISSACGGQGTCGLCRVHVEAGGGDVLPTERPHLSPGQIRDGLRLACQVRVRSPVTVALAGVFSEARNWTCRVRSARFLATYIKEIVLELPPGDTMDFRAGAYVQVQIPPHHLRFADLTVSDPFSDAWDQPDLRSLESETPEPVSRAYSLANYPGEGPIIVLNVRIALPPPDEPDAPPGVGSSYLFSLGEGDTLEVSGPFGDFYATDSGREMCFIGGGAGMAPLRAHVLDQLKRLGSSRTTTFWYGARSLGEAFYVEEFEALAREYPTFRWELALSEPKPEDCWDGSVGFIHEVARDRYLRHHDEPEMVEYYLCGPPAMIRATLQMLKELGVDPQDIRYDQFA